MKIKGRFIAPGTILHPIIKAAQNMENIQNLVCLPQINTSDGTKLRVFFGGMYG
jgi:hypothetical protein